MQLLGLVGLHELLVRSAARGAGAVRARHDKRHRRAINQQSTDGALLVANSECTIDRFRTLCIDFITI